VRHERGVAGDRARDAQQVQQRYGGMVYQQLGDILRAERKRVSDERGGIVGDRLEGGIPRVVPGPHAVLNREATVGDGHTQGGHEPLGHTGRQRRVRDDRLGGEVVDDGAVAADGEAAHAGLLRQMA